MQEKNEILFPIDATEKHPHTREVIKLAESAGISLTEISEMLKCSQPYVSQLKAGKGKAKIVDLEPLISLLSPKLPGDNFYTYTIFREAKPLLPDDWEQQVLMKGLTKASLETEHGRYPVGDEGFDIVEEQHYNALDHIDENGHTYRYNNSPLDFFRQIKDRENELREAYDSYVSETKAENESLKRNDEELKRWTTDILRSLPLHSELTDQAIQIEDTLNRLLKPRYDNANRLDASKAWRNSTLVEACRGAASNLQIPPLIKPYVQEMPLDLADSELVLAPDIHAARLLTKLESYQQQLDTMRLKKRNLFRLNALYQQSKLSTILNQRTQDPRNMPNWGEYGKELFGNYVCKVFRSANIPPYEINLSEAFLQWSSCIEYQVDEEQVQICGKMLHSETLDGIQIVIHELNSKKFVYLYTFYCEALKREVTLLSKPLSAVQLLEQLKAEDGGDTWAGEVGPLIIKLKNSLSQSGYRVPGIRAVY
ncbi:hypothetical protein [Shewanella inventionis]|uniref:HTH cro/C1-type domain-containing protein n=1 Tax=Shewanella inventionis TaxID=1738770 RepID=A0ABQ1JVB1_9GAMM|nr:hypothetical protein [Shewanella inventionis]MCL1159829.1 hypothetical protein [Shewanella inventionis]GGB75442.1 hypothetical protein GCM10011607_39680 [Shewanella inventionis]